MTSKKGNDKSNRNCYKSNRNCHKSDRSCHKSNRNCHGEISGDGLVVGGGFAAYFEGADEEEDGDGQESDPAYEAEAVHEG